MVIMGIDPATYEVGIGIVKSSEMNRIDFLDVHHVSVKERTPLSKRLKIIYSEMSKIVKKYEPDYVMIESQYLGKNPDSFRKICYSVGVIWIAALLNSNTNVNTIEPKKWRKLALGKGNASKKDAIKQMSQYFNLDPADYKEDDFEALGIAVATAKLITQEEM